jgi:general secretion pathway protein M
MQDWWQSRSPREQMLVLAAVGVLVLLGFYLAVWEPLQQARKSTQAQVEQLQADLRWMQAARSRLQATPQSATTASASTALPRVIEQSLSQAGLSKAVQRIDARERENIRVIFDAVAFDDLMLWLSDLRQRYGVSVAQLSVDAARLPGQVNARIVLQ